MHQIMNKQTIIEAIMREMAAQGFTFQRSYCGKYTIINHGCSGYYDDLKFFLRQRAFWIVRDAAEGRAWY